MGGKENPAKENSAKQNVVEFLSKLTPEGFDLLQKAIAEMNLPKATEVLSVKEEDILRLLFLLERFPVTDEEVVRMTVYEREKESGGEFPPYDPGSGTTFAYGVRNALMCLKDHPQSVKELILPERVLSLPEFRFAVLKAVLQEIPVRTEAGGIPEITVVLRKKPAELSASCPHVILHRVLNPGNIGAILRSAVAFGFRDIAFIGTVTDGWDPEIISVSRCTSLHARIQCFESISAYRECFPEHALYPMMLQSSVLIEEALSRGVPELYSIILGNESRGLPSMFADLGTPVRIPIETVGSLNVSAAAAVSFYAFTRGKENNERKEK